MPVKRLGAIYGEAYYRQVSVPADGGPPVITTLEDFAFHPRGPLARIAAAQQVELPPLSEVGAASPVRAFVNNDRWVVACPDCHHDVQFVWMSTPLFMCSACWNAGAGGRWRRVRIPRNRAAIEGALGERAYPEQRHWLPGESVAHLRAETADPERATRIVRLADLWARVEV